MKTTHLFSLILCLSFLSLPGCKESQRKDQPKKVAEESLELLEAYAQELLKYDIVIDGPNPTTKGKNFTRLKIRPFNSKEEADVRGLLEKYVHTANRLVKLGDTRAVVFNESSGLIIKNERAQIYLGELYAVVNGWEMTDSGHHTPKVDYAELEARNARISEFMNKHIGQGFDITKWPGSAGGLDKYSTPQLRELSEGLHLAMADSLRNTVLARRNKGWGSPVMLKGFTMLGELAGLFYQMNEVVKIVLEAREKKK